MTFYEFYVRIDLAEHFLHSTNLAGAAKWLEWLDDQPTVARIAGDCASCGAEADRTDKFCRACGYQLDLEEVPPTGFVNIFEEKAVLGSALAEALRQTKGTIIHYKNGVGQKVTGEKAAAKLRSASRYGAQVFEV